MKILRGLLVPLALMASPALAQAHAPSGVATARALIEADHVGDLFEAVEDANIEVRHKASGLICHFYDNETTQRLLIFSGQPRGYDVGCAREREGQAVTLYATRYTPAISLQQALADAEAGIRNRFSDAQPTPALLSMTSEALPDMRVQHFLVTVRGERWLTSALVAQSREWIIMVRYSQRAVDQDALLQAQLEANAIMTLALLDIRGRQH
jgi:hypothetical protein